MLTRILEPEIMDDPDESAAYDDMDHARVNQTFVQDLLSSEFFQSIQDKAEPSLDILDVGTGTARIPIELCHQYPHCRVLALDAAATMLEIARVNVAVAGLEHRIELRPGDGKQLALRDELFDCIMSNSLIHHLPQPQRFIDEIARVVRPGGGIFVRDLCRPESEQAIEQLVEAYAGQEPAESQQLFRQSLHAALTVEDMQQCAQAAGYSSDSVRMTSDRHWTWQATRPT